MNQQSDLITLKTGIPDLDRLLNTETQAAKEQGILFRDGYGFLGIVLGAAGTGKSLLALQIACSSKLQIEDHGMDFSVVYLSHEPAASVIGRLKTFSKWSTHENSRPDLECNPWDDRLIYTDKHEGWFCKSGLHIVQLPFDAPSQVDVLLNIVAHAKLDPKKPVRWLLVFDNAETILSEAYDKAFELDPIDDRDPIYGPKGGIFFKKLRQHFAEKQINSIFFFEESSQDESGRMTSNVSKTALAYAADIVIHLTSRTLAEYRQRTIEIVKARNQAHRRGQHHFSIHGGTSDTPGIVIYPSVATQLHIIGNRDLPDSERLNLPDSSTDNPCQLGIDEIDREVYAKNHDDTDSSIKGYLNPGTVSVLVSDLDSLASEIALHFALMNEGPTLYLSTLHRKGIVETMIDHYSQLKDAPKAEKLIIQELQPEHISDGKLLHDIDEWIKRMLGEKTGSCVGRVVVDNVFKFSKKFPLINDEGQFLAVLFALLRDRGVSGLVVDMVEVGEGTNPLNDSFAAGLADNVFVLRHVELRSEVSKVFSIAKLAGLHEPEKLWELRSTPNRIVAEDRLAFYKGVLSGKPEPVEVLLSLFAESVGSPVHNYLQTECEVLQATFGQTIKVHTCHTDNYGALQNSVELRNLRALGDCHVISIDEIWLGALLRRSLLQNFEIEPLSANDPHRNSWLDKEFVTVGRDIAVDREAGWLTINNGSPPRPEKGSIVVPERNNIGVLAYNPNVWSMCDWDETHGGACDSRSMIADVITDFNLGWEWSAQNAGEQEAAPEWAMLEELQASYVQHLYKRIKSMPANNSTLLSIADSPVQSSIYRSWEVEEDNGCWEFKGHPRADQGFASIAGMPEAGVFTFSMDTRETCVSFFLELLLSLWPPGSFPVKTDGKVDGEKGELDWSDRTPWREALERLLKLTAPWDLVRLSHGWYRPARVERPCLFSRTWFSGWGMLGKKQPGMVPLELPRGVAGTPTCVSGTWYLGILSGGTAQRAGVQIIQQLTSPEQELAKFNRGIGMPVRRALYEAALMAGGGGLIDARQKVLYADHMKDIAVKLDVLHGKTSAKEEASAKAKATALQELLQSRCPFFRESIRDYRHVSQLLMGMMSKAATIAVKSPWLWNRDNLDFEGVRRELDKLVQTTAGRYKNLDVDYIKNRYHGSGVSDK